MLFTEADVQLSCIKSMGPNQQGDPVVQTDILQRLSSRTVAGERPRQLLRQCGALLALGYYFKLNWWDLCSKGCTRERVSCSWILSSTQPHRVTTGQLWREAMGWIECMWIGMALIFFPCVYIFSTPTFTFNLVLRHLSWLSITFGMSPLHFKHPSANVFPTDSEKNAGFKFNKSHLLCIVNPTYPVNLSWTLKYSPVTKLCLYHFILNRTSIILFSSEIKIWIQPGGLKMCSR